MLARRSLLQTASSTLPSTSHATPWLVQTRTVISLKPSVVFPRKVQKPRVYDDRKTFLFNRYTNLLKANDESPILFFSWADFSVKRIHKLRLDLEAAARRHATPKPSLSSPDPAPEPSLPKFTIMRSALLGIVLRDYAPMDRETAQGIVKIASGGGLAVLTLPHLNPPQLNAVLNTLSRAVPPRIPKTAAEIEQERKLAEAAFVPGRRPKRQRPEPIPELKLRGALIEGRLMGVREVQEVAKLPTLETLRAQLVGLISAPSAQITAVLSQASGGKLARTLEGLKKSLEEGQSTSADGP